MLSLDDCATDCCSRRIDVDTINKVVVAMDMVELTLFTVDVDTIIRWLLKMNIVELLNLKNNVCTLSEGCCGDG